MTTETETPAVVTPQPAVEETKAAEGTQGEQQEPCEEVGEPMSLTEAVQELTSVYVHKLIQLENAFGANHAAINFEATTAEGRTFIVNVKVKRSNSASDSKENQMSKSTKKPAAKKASKKAPAKKKVVAKKAAKKTAKKK